MTTVASQIVCEQKSSQIDMSATVSNDYPVVEEEFNGNDYLEYFEKTKGSIRYLVSCIGADCWGVKHNDIPLFNTYPLYKKVGCSFGKGKIHNDQYEFEKEVRRKIYSDEDAFIQSLKNEDVLEIYMFGGMIKDPRATSWVIRVVKQNDRFTFRCYYTSFDYSKY